MTEDKLRSLIDSMTEILMGGYVPEPTPTPRAIQAESKRQQESLFFYNSEYYGESEEDEGGNDDGD